MSNFGKKDLPAKFYIQLGEVLSLSDEITTTSHQITTRIETMEREIESLGITVSPKLSNDIQEIKKEVSELNLKANNMNDKLGKIEKQTKEKTGKEWFIEKMKENIFGFFVGYLLGKIF